MDRCLIINVLLSVLILYFGRIKHSHGKIKSKVPAYVVPWQLVGQVTTSRFDRYELRLTLLSTDSAVDVCVDPVSASDVIRDPDIYVTYDITTPVSYELNRHDASATSFGTDCVRLEFGDDVTVTVGVGVYGYASDLELGVVPYRLYVLASGDNGVDVVANSEPRAPTFPKATEDSERDGTAGDKDQQHTSGNFGNPQSTPRFARRDSSRKRKTEPVIWTILIGFLNILAEIL